MLKEFIKKHSGSINLVITIFVIVFTVRLLGVVI